MKKLLFAMIAIFSAGFVIKGYAQDDIQKVQEEWGKDKKELVRLVMELTPSDSVKFWPIYDRYEKERQKLGRDRIMLLDDYSANYANLTSAKADELVTKIFKNDAALTKLQQQYYTSIKTALNALQAAKFIQVESYINAAIKSALQEELPIIGELDHMKKNL